MQALKSKKKRNEKAAEETAAVVDVIYSTDQQMETTGKVPWGFKAL